VNAEWLAEAAAASDATPSFTGPTIPVYKAAAWLYGSYEVLMDSGFAQVAELMADAKNRLEATAHVSGTGNGMPTGLLTALSGVGPVITGTSSTYLSGAYSLATGLGARWQNTARWLTNKATTLKVRQEASALPSQTVWSDLAGGVPAELLGSPVHLNSVMTGSSGDYPVIHGAFDNYKVIDRIGTTILFEPMIRSTGSNTPTGQAGWFAYFRTGANVVNSSAFKVLRILGS
jgi:HK97 family phage major capsid protein